MFYANQESTMIKIAKTNIDSQEGIESQIFLGTWCMKNHSNYIEDKRKYKFVPYHWKSKEKYKQDYDYLDKIYENKLQDCSKHLNRIHNLDKDLRFWRIIIGPWLRFFIDALFDRYECIRSSQKYYENTEFTIHEYENKIPMDFNEFYENLTSDFWNEIIFSECIKFQKVPHVFSKKKISKKIQIPSKNLFKKLVENIIQVYQRIISKFSRKITIISPYINLLQSIKIQTLLKGFPYIMTFQHIAKPNEINFDKRDEITFKSTHDDFESFLNTQIKQYLPQAYLEKFNEYNHVAENNFPRKTKLIYTANAYQSDDLFKIWAAHKTSNESKLIIGQHGGTFGLSLHNQTEKHQLKISDKFISWGWRSQNFKNIVTKPSLKLHSHSKMSVMQNNKGKIVHVLGCVPRYFYNFFSMPIAGDYIDYLNDQIQFLKKLENSVIDRIEIRHDASSNNWGWEVEDFFRINGFDKNVKTKNPNFINQLNKSALSISSHNGTVPLETLALNFPTVIFWDREYYQIRSDAKEYIDLLKDVGIFYDCPVMAAEHINSISNDISFWWNQKNVQQAVKLFTNKYALHSKDALKILKNFLNDEARLN